jgi:hypothetical protein
MPTLWCPSPYPDTISAPFTFVLGRNSGTSTPGSIKSLEYDTGGTGILAPERLQCSQASALRSGTGYGGQDEEWRGERSRGQYRVEGGRIWRYGKGGTRPRSRIFVGLKRCVLACPTNQRMVTSPLHGWNRVCERSAYACPLTMSAQLFSRLQCARLPLHVTLVRSHLAARCSCSSCVHAHTRAHAARRRPSMAFLMDPRRPVPPTAHPILASRRIRPCLPRQGLLTTCV